MKGPKLAEFIKSGYHHVKDEVGLASWVLPEHGLNRIVDEVGDDGILKLAQPLGLAEGAARLLKNAPGPADVSLQAWQDAVGKWQYLSQVAPVIAAFLKVAGPVMAQLLRIKPIIDPAVICRNTAVLLFAPFVDQGKAVLEEVAKILGKANSPTELILGYGEAVGRRDITTLEKVDQGILKYSPWQEWASGMQEQVVRCRHTPKLVAVTPAPSMDVIGLLARMIKEGQDEPSGDNSECSGDQVIAQ